MSTTTHDDRMQELALAVYRDPAADLTAFVAAGYAAALREVIDRFGDLEWPTGEDTYDVLAVQIHKFAASLGIDITESEAK